MLSRALENTLQEALQYTADEAFEFFSLEHLMLFLLDNSSAKEALVYLGANLEEMRDQLKTYIDQHNPRVLNPKRRHQPQPTLGLDRVIHRAIHHVQSSARAHAQVEGIDVLIAMFSEEDSYAVYVLHTQQIEKLDLTSLVSHSETLLQAAQFNEQDEDAETEQDHKKVADYLVNLNEKSQKGLIDPLVGRDKEIQRTAQILCRRKKNNPLLVGDPGVGKTAIAEGLAWLIVQGRAPAPLLDATIFALDVGSLVAGTKYRGDFEKRMKSLLTQLKKIPNAILFIDEIHMIIGAGSSMGSGMDMSNLIKPALAEGSLRCIGSTTFQEYRGSIEKDHALARRFQKIDVVEPSVTEAIQILHGLKTHFEQFHAVTYTDAAIESAVQLSAKHMRDRFLPDKAIDIIDEAGAKKRLTQTEQVVIDVPEVEAIVAQLARIPAKTVSADDTAVLENLERDLRRVVFGQDKAIQALATSIKLARAGLKSPNKPIGSFLLAGPTGVGKTELARQLSFLLGIPLVRFDMSEYMERHTVSRLIGAPPGYVGFDQGGLLTDAIYQSPHAVLLLDEIEKAHPDVYNLLLQVMDHGTLTDNNGRKSDFRNVILLMTTNVGADVMSKTSIGFNTVDRVKESLGHMKLAFAPEFRNRLDAIVQFNPLSPEHVLSVADKFIVELETQLHDKHVELVIDAAAREWLAKKGYDPLMGARPMQRVVQDYLKKPLAEKLLFGDLKQGGKVKITLVEDKEGQASLSFKVSALRRKSPKLTNDQPRLKVEH